MKTQSAAVKKRSADLRARNRTTDKKQRKAHLRDRDDLLLTQAIQLAARDAWIRQERNRALGTAQLLNDSPYGLRDHGRRADRTN